MQSDAKARTALILGATGLVGRYCLDYLLEQKAYHQVTAIVRRPLNRTHPKLIERIIDFEDIGKYRDYIKGQDIYCCFGTTFLKSPLPSEYYKIDFNYPYDVAEIAFENGAERFVLVSALSANPRGVFPYSRVKGSLEQAISELGYRSVIILRPSYLIGKRKEWRPIEMAGSLVLKILSPMLIGLLRKMRPIKARAVAKVMVHLGLTVDEGRVVYENDQIQEIYDELRRSDLRHSYKETHDKGFHDTSD